MEIFKLGKVNAILAAKVFGIIHLEDTGLSDQGNGYWVFMFASSDLTQTIFGGYFLTQYYSKIVGTSTDLSSATILAAGGDSLLSRFPSTLLKRIEIKDTPYYINAAPRIDNFLSSKKQNLHLDAICLDIRTAPMCSELNLHFKMTPSFVSAQIVLDS